jgi:hypothetical protein
MSRLPRRPESDFVQLGIVEVAVTVIVFKGYPFEVNLSVLQKIGNGYSKREKTGVGQI